MERMINAILFKKIFGFYPDNLWRMSDTQLREWMNAEAPEANRVVYVDKVLVEPLTDTEQRIFYAAMRREEEICEHTDLEYGPELGGIGLVKVCNEITRKVTGALF